MLQPQLSVDSESEATNFDSWVEYARPHDNVWQVAYE